MTAPIDSVFIHTFGILPGSLKVSNLKGEEVGLVGDLQEDSNSMMMEMMTCTIEFYLHYV